MRLICHRRECFNLFMFPIHTCGCLGCEIGNICHTNIRTVQKRPRHWTLALSERGMRGEDINHIGEREKRRWSIGAGCETAEWMGSGPTLACIPSIHPNSQGERRIDVGGRGEDIFIEGLPIGKHFDFH